MTFGPTTPGSDDPPATGPQAPGTLAGEVEAPAPASPHRPLSRRAERLRRRAALWEARRNGPPPPRHLHRALILLVLMAVAVLLLYLLIFQSAPANVRG